MSQPGLIPSYERDPDAIYRASFETIAREADLARLPAALRPVATRVIHACGMIDVLDDLEASDDCASAAADALAAGRPVLVDAPMVAQGIQRHRLGGAPVICRLDDSRVPDIAESLRTTRSAAAVDLWRPLLADAVVTVGNAPTALFRLLELLADGAPRPAAVLGFPVGFVGAAESKRALATLARDWSLPFITVHGRRGGSAMAAAAVNALAGGPPASVGARSS